MNKAEMIVKSFQKLERKDVMKQHDAKFPNDQEEDNQDIVSKALYDLLKDELNEMQLSVESAALRVDAECCETQQVNMMQVMQHEEEKIALQKKDIGHFQDEIETEVQRLNVKRRQTKGERLKWARGEFNVRLVSDAMNKEDVQEILQNEKLSVLNAEKNQISKPVERRNKLKVQRTKYHEEDEKRKRIQIKVLRKDCIVEKGAPVVKDKPKASERDIFCQKITGLVPDIQSETTEAITTEAISLENEKRDAKLTESPSTKAHEEKKRKKAAQNKITTEYMAQRNSRKKLESQLERFRNNVALLQDMYSAVGK